MHNENNLINMFLRDPSNWWFVVGVVVFVAVMIWASPKGGTGPG